MSPKLGKDFKRYTMSNYLIFFIREIAWIDNQIIKLSSEFLFRSNVNFMLMQYSQFER